MSGTTRLLACGLISADITFRVGEMPRRAEKYRADDVRFSLGGGGAIAAVAMQRLGAEVQLAGRLGDDLFGDLLRTEIARRSLGDRLLTRMVDGKSPISSVFVDDGGERQIVNYRQPDTLRSAESATAACTTDAVACQSEDALPFDDARLQSIDTPHAILVDTRWEAAAIQMLTFARQAGIPAVIDGEAPVSHTAMALASHVAFSRQGLRDYAGVDELEAGLRQAQAQFGNWVCVTDGENGVFHLQDGTFTHTPAIHVKAVDTLGAGDVWHAAFTLQLAQGQSESRAIGFANAAAALKCASDKGLDGIPSSKEVLESLNRSR
ncbi:PfkB family carbohydrate kinase [Granulosicoccus sp. 3-233]|uniref:PfkB family carbohydrate kinase n=1 Tax=Granulosicoccus sp. 3-233 TaxID=3417969 RepID=UPI003D34A24C